MISLMTAMYRSAAAGRWTDHRGGNPTKSCSIALLHILDSNEKARYLLIYLPTVGLVKSLCQHAEQHDRFWQGAVVLKLFPFL